MAFSGGRDFPPQIKYYLSIERFLPLLPPQKEVAIPPAHQVEVDFC